LSMARVGAMRVAAAVAVEAAVVACWVVASVARLSSGQART